MQVEAQAHIAFFLDHPPVDSGLVVAPGTIVAVAQKGIQAGISVFFQIVLVPGQVKKAFLMRIVEFEVHPFGDWFGIRNLAGDVHLGPGFQF